MSHTQLLSRRCLDVLCQAEDGIRDLVRSRGLRDVYKRQDPILRDSENVPLPEVPLTYEADVTHRLGTIEYRLSLIHL